MLLYPTVKPDLHLQYNLHGHRISIRTIDLTQDWQEIHEKLLDLVLAPVSVFS
jgi:5-methylcytosine-specific restriction enzyme subunit McrC